MGGRTTSSKLGLESALSAHLRESCCDNPDIPRGKQAGACDHRRVYLSGARNKANYHKSRMFRKDEVSRGLHYVGDKRKSSGTAGTPWRRLTRARL